MIKFASTVDLSQHADVTQCNAVLLNEEDIYVRIYKSLGCPAGSIGKYVYIYKPEHGNVLLGEVVVLPQALISQPSKIEGKFRYHIRSNYQYKSWNSVYFFF